MPKSGPDFDPTAYAPVADRIALFYQRFPEGQILTRLVSRKDCEVTFVARVYRSPGDVRPSATGWASERADDGDIDAVACLENTETSAVGRALANLGFTASRQRPSAEEMAKAARARARLARSNPESTRTEGAVRLRPSPRVQEPTAREYAAEARSRRADATLDALRLLTSAERAGLDAARADSLRARLRDGLSLTSIQRLEAALRKLLMQRGSHRQNGDTMSRTSLFISGGRHDDSLGSLRRGFNRRREDDRAIGGW